MKNCITCNHVIDTGDFIFCNLNVPNEVFELDCEHAECPSWEGEE